MPESVTLEYLTLHPLPPRLLPKLDTDQDRARAQHKSGPAQLVSEAHAILDHPGWSHEKSWHDGLVKTYHLDHTLVRSRSVAASPSISANNAEQAPATPSAKRRGWFGSAPDHRPSHNDAADEGIGWWLRRSKLSDEQAPFDVMYSLLGLDHTIQEQHYVSNLAHVHDRGQDVFLKQYTLPFPTTDRSFLCHVTVHIVSDDEFLVVSLPVNDEGDTEVLRLDKHHVRGRLVSVERIKRTRQNGELVTEWSCCSRSTPGGSIPVRVAESHMAASLADSVPPFLQYLEKHTGVPVRSRGASKRESLLHRASSEMQGLSRSISRTLRFTSDEGSGPPPTVKAA
ncbi:hypothetical protein OIV83_001726 [Microbotryomycetes sp. JL201]|nr:hypothetical protein OIV83_001726 [Microbotryomycetes sp. JL201]